MSGMFNPDGTPDMAKLDSMSKDEIINLLATQRASQGRQNPYSMIQQSMQMQQQRMPGQAAAPQIRRGQAANVASPYEELMKLQQMQQMRQRPQSLL